MDSPDRDLRELDHGSGKLPKLIDTEVPSTQKFTDTLISEADLFKKLADAISNDVPWVKEIPEPKPLIEVLVDPEDVEKIPESPLSALSLDDIFLHIQSRVESITVNSDKNLEMKNEVLRSLGKASRGILGTQIWLLADIGRWLAELNDGAEIPK